MAKYETPFQLTASLAAAISAMPAADPQQMIYYYPTTSYVQPQGPSSIETKF